VSVNGASAIASEPIYIAPSPNPTASGEPLRAPISKFSSPANRKASAKAPRSRGSDAFTASIGERPRLSSSLTRCAMTSVSVSVANLTPLRFQLAPQFGEILDDAVVHDGEPIGRMRMRVVLGRPAMRRPAGVADADRSRQRLAREPLFQILQFAFGAAPRQHAVLERGDARGVIAAVFEALERIDEQWRDRLVADDPDDAAHPCG
jgi:hypothetical protein